jgi:hypothetical protein
MEHLNILVELRKKYKKEFINRGNEWDGERLRIKEEIKKSISETSERNVDLNRMESVMFSIPTFIIEKDIIFVIQIYSNKTNKQICLLSSIFTALLHGSVLCFSLLYV